MEGEEGDRIVQLDGPAAHGEAPEYLLYTDAEGAGGVGGARVSWAAVYLLRPVIERRFIERRHRHDWAEGVKDGETYAHVRIARFARTVRGGAAVARAIYRARLNVGHRLRLR